MRLQSTCKWLWLSSQCQIAGTWSPFYVISNKICSFITNLKFKLTIWRIKRIKLSPEPSIYHHKKKALVGFTRVMVPSRLPFVTINLALSREYKRTEGSVGGRENILNYLLFQFIPRPDRCHGLDWRLIESADTANQDPISTLASPWPLMAIWWLPINVC